MNILIADDNATNRKLLHATLEAEGHCVYEAEDGEKALAILDVETVDAIVSDILMPRMDGYRLCYEVRKSERFRHIPFLAYTSTYTSLADEKLCMDLGCDRYIRKPASTEDLISAIEESIKAPRGRPSIELSHSEALREYSERLVDKLEEKNATLKLRSEELRSTHAQLRHVLAHSPAVIYALKVEGDTVVPYMASDNITEALGHSVEDALSYEWWSESIHPEDRGIAFASLAETFAKGVGGTEYRLRHKEGHYKWVEDKRRLIVSEVDGSREIIGVWSDITERRKAEEAFRTSEERFIAMLENVDLIAVLLDPRGGTIFCNDYLLRLTGWDRDEVIGEDWFATFVPEHHADIRKEAFLTSIQAGTITPHQEGPIRTRSGDVREISWNNTIQRDADGNVTGTASIGEDITERNNLQQQLLHSQKMESLGALAGGVAHDFNNLLTGMLGYAELSQMKLPEDSPVQPYLEEIRKAARRAADLTRQLLMFARKEMVEPTVICLNDLCMGMESLIRQLLTENVELITVFSPKLGSVRVDPSQFEQVLMNLAVNARDAMSKGGQLAIETRNVTVAEPIQTQRDVLNPGHYVQITVSDSGDGMTKEVQAKVFDPFFTTKEKGKGTGLGLSTCYGIVQNSGGHIWLYSEPGVGTTFKIYLPRVDDVPEAPSSAAPREIDGQGESVLVVEDEAIVLDLVTTALSDRGYRVLQATTANAAIELLSLHKKQIHLLVTDLIMPGLSGRELADFLEVVRPSTKVLFMSGYTDDALMRQGLLTHNLFFLQKPFSQDGLAQKVREVLDHEGKE